MRLLFMLILAFASGPLPVRAQAYLEEKDSGYQGAFIPELKQPKDALSFLVMGDWGRNGAYYQKEVAEQMTRAAVTMDAEFIVSVGDNFYPSGVQSVDDPQWYQSFENIYNSHPLNRDWYVVLGNHDYAGNIQAQIDYTSRSRRWQMPATYYSKKVELEVGKELLLVFMDTNPFMDSYYEKGGMFKTNLQQQDTAAQRKWLSETLRDTSAAIQWRIVVGHHPLYTGGKRVNSEDTRAFEQKFRQFFDAHKVDAYLCGHEHDLQVIRPDSAYTTQFLSGAACEIRPTGNRAGTLFAAAEPGFMVFSITPDELLVQVVNAEGKISYTTSISK